MAPVQLLPAGKTKLLAPNFDYVEAWWAGAMKPFRYLPTVLVVHCGSKRRALAEYMHNPVDKPRAPLTVVCRDGKWRRQVATQWAWRASTETLVQCLSLHLEGWGTGPDAMWRGYVVQRIAVHVELAGPPEQDRVGHQVAELRWCATATKLLLPSVEYWFRHSDCDPAKQDPGPGLPNDCLDGILEYAPR